MDDRDVSAADPADTTYPADRTHPADTAYPAHSADADGASRSTTPATSAYYVGIDGSAPSHAALRWGVQRASEHGAEIVLVHVINDEFGNIGLDYEKAAEAAAATRLADAAEAAQRLNPRVRIRSMMLRGSPAWELATLPGPADLLIVGTNPGGLPDGRGLGSRSALIASLARCSVAIVPDTWLTSEPAAPEPAAADQNAADQNAADQNASEPSAAGRVRSSRNSEVPAGRGVVVGVDWSAGSEPAVTTGAREAKHRGQELVIVHASGSAGEQAGYPGTAMEALLRNSVAVAAHAAPGNTVRTRAVHAPAAEALIDASRTASLLVIGATLRHNQAEQVLRTVTHEVVMNVAVPVLIARHPLS
jgi:nucleotide-binding universal stress UspA family protein